MRAEHPGWKPGDPPLEPDASKTVVKGSGSAETVETDGVDETITKPLQKAVTSINENRKKYEEQTGTKIPSIDADEFDPDEIMEEPEPEIPHVLIALLVVVAALVVGFVLFRDKVMGFFKFQQPPMPPRGGASNV